jgi:hypothetical protein
MPLGALGSNPRSSGEPSIQVFCSARRLIAVDGLKVESVEAEEVLDEGLGQADSLMLVGRLGNQVKGRGLFSTLNLVTSGDVSRIQ